MGVEQRCQSTPVFRIQPLPQTVLLQRPLHEDGVDQHQTVLQKLQGKQGDLLLLPAVGGQFAAPAIWLCTEKSLIPEILEAMPKTRETP